MNKLQIAQMVNTLAATQGEVDNAETATGYQAALVLMVDKAYKDIQTYRKYWNFMRGVQEGILLGELTNTASTQGMREVARVRYDYGVIREIDYDQDYILKDQTTLIPGKPQTWTKDPYQALIMFNRLDADYRVGIDYWKIPDVMTTNSAIPIIPEEHHYAIVYKALMNLGGYLGNDDLISDYSIHYDYEMGELMRSQLPQHTLEARPFA